MISYQIRVRRAGTGSQHDTRYRSRPFAREQLVPTDLEHPTGDSRGCQQRMFPRFFTQHIPKASTVPWCENSTGDGPEVDGETPLYERRGGTIQQTTTCRQSASAADICSSQRMALPVGAGRVVIRHPTAESGDTHGQALSRPLPREYEESMHASRETS